MQYTPYDKGFLIRIDRKEEVTSTLTKFLEENEIQAGSVQGLGALKDVELGFYDLEARTYLRKTIPETVELIQYMGNITLLEGKPFIHAHAVVSGSDFIARSGHFFEGVVAVTGEFLVTPADWNVNRAMDEEVGLNLMDLNGS